MTCLELPAGLKVHKLLLPCGTPTKGQRDSLSRVQRGLPPRKGTRWDDGAD